jgi:hypothetical protein
MLIRGVRMILLHFKQPLIKKEKAEPLINTENQKLEYRSQELA